MPNFDADAHITKADANAKDALNTDDDATTRGDYSTTKGDYSTTTILYRKHLVNVSAMANKDPGIFD